MRCSSKCCLMLLDLLNKRNLAEMRWKFLILVMADSSVLHPGFSISKMEMFTFLEWGITCIYSLSKGSDSTSVSRKERASGTKVIAYFYVQMVSTVVRCQSFSSKELTSFIILWVQVGPKWDLAQPLERVFKAFSVSGQVSAMALYHCNNLLSLLMSWIK